MIVTTRTLLLGVFALGLIASGSAQTGLTPVLLYDADQSTTTGSTPTVLDAGIADIIITDVSGAGNHGKVGSGAGSFSQFVGIVETVEDDPFNVAGELSFRFNGSSSRINTDAVDLLTDDAIAAAGGYTMETYIKTSFRDSSFNAHTFLSFAGTDGLLIREDQLSVQAERGKVRIETGIDISDGVWHHVLLQVDTSADPDGTANSTPGGDGVHGLDGAASVFVDGNLVATGALDIGDFGDFLNRSIGVGGHPQGFFNTEFTGLLYNPSVSLGVVPEPSTMLMAFIAVVAACCGRKK